MFDITVSWTSLCFGPLFWQKQLGPCWTTSDVLLYFSDISYKVNEASEQLLVSVQWGVKCAGMRPCHHKQTVVLLSAVRLSCSWSYVTRKEIRESCSVSHVETNVTEAGSSESLRPPSAAFIMTALLQFNSPTWITRPHWVQQSDLNQEEPGASGGRIFNSLQPPVLCSWRTSDYQ